MKKCRKTKCGATGSSLNSCFISSCCSLGVKGQKCMQSSDPVGRQSRAMMSSSSSSAPDWSVRGRFVEVSPVSESGCFLLVAAAAAAAAAELDDTTSSSSESTIMTSSSSDAAGIQRETDFKSCKTSKLINKNIKRCFTKNINANKIASGIKTTETVFSANIQCVLTDFTEEFNRNKNRI